MIIQKFRLIQILFLSSLSLFSFESKAIHCNGIGYTGISFSCTYGTDKTNKAIYYDMGQVDDGQTHPYYSRFSVAGNSTYTVTVSIAKVEVYNDATDDLLPINMYDIFSSGYGEINFAGEIYNSSDILNGKKVTFSSGHHYGAEVTLSDTLRKNLASLPALKGVAVARFSPFYKIEMYDSRYGVHEESVSPQGFRRWLTVEMTVCGIRDAGGFEVDNRQRDLALKDLPQTTETIFDLVHEFPANTVDIRLNDITIKEGDGFRDSDLYLVYDDLAGNSGQIQKGESAEVESKDQVKIYGLLNKNAEDVKSGQTAVEYEIEIRCN